MRVTAIMIINILVIYDYPSMYTMILYYYYCIIIINVIFTAILTVLIDVMMTGGINEGSVPKVEWEEILVKMSQFVKVLTTMNRPAMNKEFSNPTAASAAMVVEELLRSGVGAFCVCPGARSIPFAVAIYRNSVARAMTQV